MTVVLNVYESDNVTFVDNIETARKIAFLSDLTSAGTLTFQFSSGDESTTTLIQADRIVRVELDGVDVWAGPVRAQSKARVDNDRSVVNVTCVGMRALCSTAIVYPEVFAPGFPTTDTRLFGFMSTGKDVSSWDFALSHGTWTSQPFSTLRPTLWPDGDAQLIWSAHTGSPAKVAVGDVYFVKDFNTDEDHLCTLYASADDEVVVWVDGIELIRREGPSRFNEFDQVTFVLPAGMHRIAAIGTNLTRPTSVGGPTSAAWIIAAILLTDENGDLPTPTDETWEVDIGTSTSGTFALLFDDVGQSGPIPYNASAAVVETAIEDIHPAIDVTVTGAGTTGDPWVIVADGPQQTGTPHMLTGNGGNLVGGTLTIDNTVDGAYATALVHTDTTWRMSAYPADVPGVTAGFILNAVLAEAQTRGTTVDPFTWTFDADLDSNGDAWTEELEMAIGVGSQIEQVVGTLFERGFWNRFEPSGEVILVEALGVDKGSVGEFLYVPRPNELERGNVSSITHDRDGYRIDRLLVRSEADITELEAASLGSPVKEEFFSAGGFASGDAFAPVGLEIIGRYSTQPDVTSVSWPGRPSLPAGSGYATGGTETEAGGYRYHTFTTGGTLEILGADLEVDILVVGGGGGANAGISGTRWACAGGGGEVVTLDAETLAVDTYAVTVGTGGAYNGTNNSTAGSGTSSSIAGVATAVGGAGASGGNSGASGSGNAAGAPGASASSGGAGGDGGVGQAGVAGTGGNGGAGTTWYDGIVYGYGGAGRGGVSTTGSPGGTGQSSNPSAQNRGGGATSYNNGGPGVVIVRYPI